MKGLFFGGGLSFIDFIAATVYFLMAMTAFFALNKQKGKWLNYLLLIAFSFYWIIIVVSGKTLETKIFTTLLLISALVVEVLVTQKRRRRHH